MNTNIKSIVLSPAVTWFGSMALLLVFAIPGYAATMSSSKTDMASEALITLATTGNPDPLHAELGGTVITSEKLQMKVGSLLKLEKQEHLAPKALVTPNGETYAMVAPTITKDNYILVDSQGNVMRMDVGNTEGHRMPFIVQNIAEDGGTAWYVQFWHWIAG